MDTWLTSQLVSLSVSLLLMCKNATRFCIVAAFLNQLIFLIILSQSA